MAKVPQSARAKALRAARKDHRLPTCPRHPDAVVKNGLDIRVFAIFRCGCRWEGGQRTT